MNLAVFGYRTIGCACLEVLLEAQVDVVGVVTAPDAPRDPETAGGFYRSITALARARSLRCLMPGKVNDPDVIASIRSLRPDAFFLFDYPQHVGPELLALPAGGAINLYATWLPDFPGHDPALRAVMQGATATGVTLHDIAPATAGLIAQQRVVIGWTDSSHDVYVKQTAAAAELLRKTLPDLLSGRAARAPLPPASTASSGPPSGPLRPEECLIDWNRPAVGLYNLIRAVSRPYPGALAGFRGRRCRIWRSDVRPAPLTGRQTEPGRILKLVPFQVDTGDGMLRPRELELEGEPPMTHEAFLEHYRVAAGESFTIGTV